MTLQELAGHFEVSRRINDNSYQCKCPVHIDDKASLTVSQENGKLLLYCHAGCDTKDILEAVGLSFQELEGKKALTWMDRLEGK